MIPNALEKLDLGRRESSPRFDDRISPNIRNMGRDAIVEPRGFGAAEIPSFEVRSVYTVSWQIFSLNGGRLVPSSVLEKVD